MLFTYGLIEELGLDALPHVTTTPGRVASDAEIEAVHDPAYVAIVKALDAGQAEARDGLAYGLGTPDDPIFAGMHAASAAVCGASVTAAEGVASGECLHAFNPAGGLHHARRSEASGFCIYNDPAVAIGRILSLEPEWRVMYVDVDVHHGDGVQWIFYDDPRVLTVSLHQSGRYLYPGTGFGSETGEGPGLGAAVNVPLQPFTGNDDYLWALGELLPRLADAFRPHVLVTQVGADTHHGDPLANLGLTMPAYPEIASLLHGVAHDSCGGRWVATGGGGYQAETIVPKVWTIYFAEMTHSPNEIPAAWLEDASPTAVSQSFRREVERSVAGVLDECLPKLAALAV